MRKIHDQRDRAELVASVQRGERVPTAADRFGVTTATAYRWIRGARDAQVPVAPPSFVELVTSGGTSAGVVVRVGVVEIEVRSGFDVGVLRAVVAALDGGSL
jgi:transposase-like protein